MKTFAPEKRAHIKRVLESFALAKGNSAGQSPIRIAADFPAPAPRSSQRQIKRVGRRPEGF